MAAINAVKQGVTTIAEMVRATYEAEEYDSQPKPNVAKASGSDVEHIELEQIN